MSKILAESYTNEKFEYLQKRFSKYIETEIMIRDISSEEDIDCIFAYIQDKNVEIPFVLHCINAFSPENKLHIKTYAELFFKLYDTYKFPIYNNNNRALASLFYHKYKIPYMETYYNRKYTPDDPEQIYDVFEKNSINYYIIRDDLEGLKTIPNLTPNKHPIKFELTPLHIACDYGAEKCFFYMLEKGATIDYQCLEFAISSKNRKIIEEILKHHELTQDHWERSTRQFDFEFFKFIDSKYHGEKKMQWTLMNADLLTTFYFYCFYANDEYTRTQVLLKILSFPVIDFLNYFFVEEKNDIKRDYSRADPVEQVTRTCDMNYIRKVFDMGLSLEPIFDTNALFYAAEVDNEELVDFYVDKKIDLNNFDEECCSCLHKAVFYGSQRTMIQLMDKYKLPVDFCNDALKTPLFEAEHPKIAKILLDRGAKIKVKLDTGYMLLKDAVMRNYDITEFLVKNGAEIPNDIFEEMVEECMPDDDDHAKTILLLGGKIPKDYNSFYKVIEENLVKSIEAFIKVGYDPNRKSKDFPCPLYNWMCRQIKPEAFEALLKNGADPNATFRNLPMLHIAMIAKNDDYVRILLQNGANPNSTGLKGNALQLAIDTKFNIKTFLKYAKGFNFNTKVIELPLMFYLVKHNMVEEISIALNRGADHEIKYKGLSPFLYAVKIDARKETLKVLIDNKCDTLAKDADGRNALHIAIKCVPKTVILKNLIELVPNLEELKKDKDNAGLNPFEYVLVYRSKPATINLAYDNLFCDVDFDNIPQNRFSAAIHLVYNCLKE
ncbi:hypothetical protein TVAG_376120 [Trichomonas vaginalis G3]|uniref:DUF3447 domain-containing protein n=1 Tax=Trichomonas vaginalis (strain ATCC PRA-98 / G3) TaxID=412133 RepID=A2FNW1_TRIV3|nr:spectrin binding [Trichomonas vaginalis G3]EAX93414.1 hypothetical protein TVAG_376120 [Trichomonas vaginalis G3]KAI5531174.1 spectrin binding [Trichomonas vaginalis G3]|eukprot:XP_001306344.1 hypothetical protein [Trichomonas vaginalis G3]